MSVNVLVIPEDFRQDQYIVRPIIERMIAALGFKKARVRVCQEVLGGIGEALKWERLEAIIDSYRGMTRLMLLIVDRDGKPGRRKALDSLEAKARDVLAGSDRVFLAVNAWQEVEVWVLAGMKDLPKAWSWTDVRADADPKEHYFAPYAAQRGLSQAVYEGRESLGREAAANYARIRKLCPDDVAVLEERIRGALGADT